MELGAADSAETRVLAEGVDFDPSAGIDHASNKLDVTTLENSRYLSRS